MFDPYEFEQIDWDDEDDEDGNLQHCLQHGVDEQVVFEVLREHAVEVRLALKSAEIAIVGPDASLVNSLDSALRPFLEERGLAATRDGVAIKTQRDCSVGIRNGSAVEGPPMNKDQRASEVSRREAAQQAADASVEPVAEVPGRAIKQMISVRVEPDLIREFRAIARARGESVSDLLRDAAASLVAANRAQLVQFQVHAQVAEAHEVGSRSRTRFSFQYASGQGQTVRQVLEKA